MNYFKIYFQKPTLELYFDLDNETYLNADTNLSNFTDISLGNSASFKIKIIPTTFDLELNKIII